ncbi:uncharacterized protein LOC129609994 [Condylostylus longicornis]|uniref:uncharacterized protein LOC129609994 n=1 Tax=Condylostylus longicornis TaxID=2530218 RepID=UPI00244DC299|nr:uncharacterized protein LOC129609994 [Condylostylus longicornis]
MEHKKCLEKLFKDMQKILQDKQENLNLIEKQYQDEKNEYANLLKTNFLKECETTPEQLFLKLQSLDLLIISFMKTIEKINSKYSMKNIEETLCENSSVFLQHNKFAKVKVFEELVAEKQVLLDKISCLKFEFERLDEAFEKSANSQENKIKDFLAISEVIKNFINNSGDQKSLSQKLSQKKAILKSLDDEQKTMEN